MQGTLRQAAIILLPATQRRAAGQALLTRLWPGMDHVELHIPPGELRPSLASRGEQQKETHLNPKCLCTQDKRQVQKDQVN